jgi:hypothetical protein
MEGILDGIRAGHVFVDAEGTKDRVLDVRATVAGSDGAAATGDAVSVAAGRTLEVAVHTVAVVGQRVVVSDNGKPFAVPAGGVVPSSGDIGFEWKGDGKPHWLRVDVRSPDGKLLLLGNPIYITP